MSQSIEDRIKESKDTLDAWKDLVPYASFIEGENSLVIDTSIPIVKQTSKFGRDTVTYTGTLNGEKARISLSPSVETPVLKGIMKGQKSFIVTKKGTGMNTRYRVVVNGAKSK